VLPDRRLFATFPAVMGEWRGHSSSLDVDVERALGLTDYVYSDFVKKGVPADNLYVAYYASQRNGLSPHSPSVCIPGNGWQIIDLQRTSYSDNETRVSLPLNRVVVARGREKQLVYYWFEERGKKIANEYVSKMYLLRDAILKNRTDGALVRLTTTILPGEREGDADRRLQEFTKIVVPNLAGYLPSETDAKIQPALNSTNRTRS
jgi:EpsI family protein